jgi:transposase
MKQSGISELERCTNTYYNWLPQILTSLEYSFSNGYTEGCNNKIKVLKRNGYGYRNFEVFRKRILNAF